MATRLNPVSQVFLLSLEDLRATRWLVGSLFRGAFRSISPGQKWLPAIFIIRGGGRRRVKLRGVESRREF